MPFTVAHAVLARPLWRAAGARLPLSGIVVGSLAPDLEYLAHLDTERTIGHLLHGVFLLDLPLALVLLALWHGLIKESVAGLVGARLRPPIDLSPFAFWPLARLGLVVGSILAGIAGHLVWDAFTHRDGFITTRVAFLEEAIGRPHVYDLFNYASTVVGMVLLALWWWRAVKPRSAEAACADAEAACADAEAACAEPARLPDRFRRIALATLIALSAAGGIANGLRLRLAGWGIETTVIGTVLGTMAAGFVTIVVVSVVRRAAYRRC